jgi:hypothetical protein
MVPDGVTLLPPSHNERLRSAGPGLTFLVRRNVSSASDYSVEEREAIADPRVKLKSTIDS